MSTYTPDVWVVLEIISDEYGTIYKVLAGWYGGFANGDSWKISSGIESIKSSDNAYEMPQSSGSTYICRKTAYKMSSLTHSIFASFSTTKSQDDLEFSIRVLDENEMSTLMEKINAQS